MKVTTLALLILFLSTSVQIVHARNEVPLNDEWKFLRADVTGAADAAFDDARWNIVSLPHTWNADDATGGQSTYYRGVGWYRRHLSIEPEQLNKGLYLWFGAASSAAEVFVNGQSIGTHKGAFGAFCFEVKHFLKAGDNLIAVRVNNAPDTDIAPLGGDFNLFGGLYRDARLLILEPVSISPLDSASNGVYVKQVKVTDEMAELEISTHVQNLQSSEVVASVQCSIADTSDIQAQTIPARSSVIVVQKLMVRTPHLWNGRKDPYLYPLTVNLTSGQALQDQAIVPIGLRYFRVDPRLGFFLNGKPYDLHGVNRHQDFGKKGWAITAREMQIDLDLIKEMGCTMVRLAHYQHAPEFYEMCDRAGLIVWAELPLVNEANSSPGFASTTRQQLSELIKQNVNHPSICFWSLYNELQFLEATHDVELQTVKELNDLAKHLDPTRLTTVASDRGIDHPANWITDLVAFNKYYGWYYDRPTDWARKTDEFHAFNPSRSIGYSEFGAGGSVKQHRANPTGAQYDGPFHPEEWQNVVHENAYQAMLERPYLWCKLIWVFADFPVARRHEGDTLAMNDKGVVTHDRSVSKDIFYFYKSQWSEEPTVHITSSRFTPRPQADLPIKVYSNCDSVELKINGTSHGTQSSRMRTFLWNGIELNQGTNRLEAVGSVNGKTIVDQCTIVIDPTQPAEVRP